jgi:hypothetical protein
VKKFKCCEHVVLLQEKIDNAIAQWRFIYVHFFFCIVKSSDQNPNRVSDLRTLNWKGLGLGWVMLQFQMDDGG